MGDIETPNTSPGEAPAAEPATSDVGSAPEPTPPIAAPATDLSPDSFEWDKWDRQSFDPFPEQAREWMKRAVSVDMADRDKLKGEHETRLAEIAEQELLYKSLIEGMGDPRLPDLENKAKQLEAWQKNALENLKALQDARAAERQDFERQRDELITRQAEDEANRWREANSWIFDGGEKQHAAMELFDEGFERDVIPELLKQPAEVVERAKVRHRELLATGATGVGKHALELAKAAFQPPAASPAAEQISGATSPHPGPPTQGRPSTNASLRELTAAAAAKNWGG